MKAALLTARETFAIKDVPQPAIAAENEVLIQVQAVGICGSDIHYYTQGGIGGQQVHHPFIIGHECSGRVAEVGSSVEKVKPGDRVMIDPALSCGQCSQCRAGRFHTCLHLSFLGCPGQREGALCEYLVLPASACHPVPPRLSPVEAILAEPLSIALHSLSFLAAPAKSTIAVLGCGPIGLSLIHAARHTGVPGIFATDKIAQRLRTAGTAGIQGSGDAAAEDICKKFLAAVPRGFDAVFECCGQQEAIDQAVDLLKPGGQLIIIGIPAATQITFDPHLIRRKEITIQNVRRQNQTMTKAIHLLAARDNHLKEIITHTFQLHETGAAFQLVRHYADGVIKAVVTL